MDTGNYKYLVEQFGEDKIVSRYEWLYNLMSDYIIARELGDLVIISTDVLNHVIVDYFVDIDRLKAYATHKEINVYQVIIMAILAYIEVDKYKICQTSLYV